MKQLRGSFLTPGGTVARLRTPTFIAFRPFRRFSIRKNAKVIFSINDCRFVETKRRVSTDGPKKSQCSPVPKVSRRTIPPDPSQICCSITGSRYKRGNNSIDDSNLPFDFSVHSHELKSIVDVAETNKRSTHPFPLDPLAVLESAFLPSFHSFNDELLNLFQIPKISSENDSSSYRPVDSVHRLSTPCERRVKKQLYSPRRLQPFTFESVHKFDDGSDDRDPTKTDLIDLPNLPNLQSGPFIFPSGRSSQIINKDLYITNRILEKIKEKETKDRRDDGVKIPEPSVKASSATEGIRSSAKCRNNVEESSAPPLHPKTAPSGLGFRTSIAEFDDLPKDHNFTDAEAQSIGSRKKFYEFLNATVPCCLIDGLHVERVEKSVSEENEQQSLNNVDELATKLSPEEHNILDTVVKQLDDFVSAKDKDLTEEENWLLPVDKEIESMILALMETAHSQEANSNISVPRAYPDIENVDIDEYDIDSLKADCERVSDTKSEFLTYEPVENFGSTIDPPNESISNGSSRGYSSSSGDVPSKKSNSHIDIKTETTIKCSRSGDNTNINIVEVQKYLDKRLPYPFSTETILQVFGSNDSLRPATQTIENSKAQLVHLSNANSPNPGMLIPKLQFNHMLSKTHDLSKMSANDKKQSLKINIVPGTSKIPYPSVTISLTEPSSPLIPSQMSKIVDATRNGEGEEAQETTKKSKIIYKGLKKGRRRETLTKFRPKKTVHEEIEENIKILSPRELDKMFPSPPKSMPVEVPRNVTVNTKAANDSKRTTQLPPTITNASLTPSMSSKVQSPPLTTKTDPPIPLSKVDKEGNISAEVSKAKMYNVMKRDEVESRNEINLKTLISGKMKDSYLSVSKRGATVTGSSNSEVNKNADESPPVKLVEFPKGVMPPAIALHEVKKETVVPKTVNEPKTVGPNSSKQATEPETKEPSHPTPLDKREYISIPKTTGSGKPSTVKLDKVEENEVDKGNKNPKGEAVLPVSAKEAIANMMKNTENSYNPEYRLIDPPLENPYKIKPGKEVIENPKISPKPDASERFSRPLKHNFHSVFDDVQKTKGSSPIVKKPAPTSASPQDQTNTQALSTSTAKMGQTLQATTHPLFFPYDTPIVKESIAPTPYDSKTNDNSVHIDFCKECKENKPSLECLTPLQCKVPLKRIKMFPMTNGAKTVGYNVPKGGAITISHGTDMMLRKTLTGVPAVTKILGATLSERSQKALERWKQGLLASLGEEGFKEFYEKQLRQGSEFHSLVGEYLLRRQASVEKPDDPCMKSLRHVFSHIGDVGVVESQVVHPQLAYRGVVDCVAKYKGKPVVIEWKRSDKAKPSVQHTYDAPLQLSAYIGAMNYDNNYGLQVNGGLVVVAHSDGSPADVFELSLEDCGHYWLQWLKRLHQYFIQEPSKRIA